MDAGKKTQATQAVLSPTAGALAAADTPAHALSAAQTFRRSGLVAVRPDRGSVGVGRRNVRVCLCIRDRGQALLCNRAGRRQHVRL